MADKYEIKFENMEADDLVQLDLSEPSSPQTGLTKLRWDHLNVYVRAPAASLIKRIKNKELRKSHKKQILTDINGEAISGQMLAIMGASGSGKTTLLNTLSGLKSSKMKRNGSITLNGKTIDMSTISAYVEQTDLFITTMTVYEYLYFNVKLILGNHLGKDEIKQRVEELLLDFGLEHCRNTMIGSPQTRKGGISGGEQRRLTIAAQVITKPKVIFFDEPTSGLDSYIAETVVNMMRKLANNDCIVISTIHQPSSQIFNKFDNLVLLSEGRVVYSGRREDALAFFSRAGFECPINYNPADFYIEKLAIKAGKESESHQIVEQLIKTKNEIENEQLIESERRHSVYEETEEYVKPKEKASLKNQFTTLLHRAWITTIRDPLLFKTRILQGLFIGLIFGLIYFQLEYNADNIQNFVGALFALFTNSSFSGTFSVIFTFNTQLDVFRREHKRGLYDTSIYFITKTLVDTPVFIIMPTLQTLVSYFLIGFTQRADTFFTIWLIYVLVTLCGVSFGYFISSISRDVSMASSLAPPLMIPLMIFGGFYIRLSNIPIYFRWIKYISWFKYGFEAIIFAQFKYAELDCTNTTIRCPVGQNYIDGTYVGKYLGLDNIGLFANIAVLILIAFILRLLSLIILSLKTYFYEKQ